MRCIASDVSAPSLQKARRLAEICGVQDRIGFRVGDGLSVLADGEADGIALLGMGGTLMARLLAAAKTPFAGADIAVFQPMRAYADIRRWLWENGYAVVCDCIVRDAGRLYQVFSARKLPEGIRQTVPETWPEDCFDLGFTAYERRDPLFLELAGQMLAQHEKRLRTAEGTPGAALLHRKADNMRMIIRQAEEWTCS